MNYGNDPGFANGVTYLHNEVKVSNGDSDPFIVKDDETVYNYKLNVEKNIVNNKYPTESDFSQIVTYEVKVNQNKSSLPDGTPTWTDTLPDGMEYVTGSLKYQAWSDKGHNIDYLESGKTGWSDLTYDSDTNSLAFNFPDGFSFDGTYLWMTYQARLTTTEIDRLETIGTNQVQRYGNRVVVTQTPEVVGTDDAEWTYTWDDGLTKEDITDEHYGTNRHGPYVFYRIVINPEERQMNSGNIMALSDHIETNMELVLSSVEVRDKNGVLQTSANGVSVSYDGILRNLTVRVPDKKKLILTFRAKIENAQEELEDRFYNQAILTGEGTWEAHDEENHTVQTMAGTVWQNINDAFFIEKIDGNDIATGLGGAEFTLYKPSYPGMDRLNELLAADGAYADFTKENASAYDLSPFVINGEDSSFVPRIIQSEANGTALFDDVPINTLYYWKETKTPGTEYSAGEFAKPQNLILFHQDRSGDNSWASQKTPAEIAEEQAYAAESIRKAKLLDALISAANGIIVNSAVEGYHWYANNNSTVQFTVDKIWVDNNNAEELRPVSIQVQLKQNGSPYDNVNTAGEYAGRLDIYLV